MAFVKIFRGLPKASFSHQNGFEAWLRRIVINEALSLIRRRKPLEQLEDHASEMPSSSGNEIIGRLTARELEGYIADLPEGYRLVLTLHAIEGYTHAEIGTLLGISEGTSKSQLSKARAVLKKKLGKRHHYAS
jgi:RNA polymerase sigma-70 factor (ECF subfamily)